MPRGGRGRCVPPGADRGRGRVPAAGTRADDGPGSPAAKAMSESTPIRDTARMYVTSVRPNAPLGIRVDADPSARNYGAPIFSRPDRAALTSCHEPTTLAVQAQRLVEGVAQQRMTKRLRKGENPRVSGVFRVGGTGLEPVTLGLAIAPAGWSRFAAWVKRLQISAFPRLILGRESSPRPAD